MQTNADVRKRVIEYKTETLLLKVDSFLPDNDTADPISTRDAVNMLGDWYWYKMLKQLRVDTYLDENEFYRQIALIEWFGYSSVTANRSFPVGKTKSFSFMKEIIARRSKEDVRFLIMRSLPLWKQLLIDVGCTKEKILCRKGKSRSQYITEGNLEEEHYRQLIEFMTYGQ